MNIMEFFSELPSCYIYSMNIIQLRKSIKVNMGLKKKKNPDMVPWIYTMEALQQKIHSVPTVFLINWTAQSRKFKHVKKS